MGFYEKINSGAYKPKVKYVSRKKDEAQWQAYKDELARLDAEFKRDALKEVGLENHPKANKAFAFAWSLGHASGFSEVFSYLEEIAEILKD